MKHALHFWHSVWVATNSVSLSNTLSTRLWPSLSLLNSAALVPARGEHLGILTTARRALRGTGVGAVDPRALAHGAREWREWREAWGGWEVRLRCGGDHRGLWVDWMWLSVVWLLWWLEARWGVVLGPRLVRGRLGLHYTGAAARWAGWRALVRAGAWALGSWSWWSRSW